MEIKHDKKEQKFFVKKNDSEAKLDYKMKEDDVIELVSTFVPEEFRGEGMAGKIVKTGLEYAKENNYKIIPTCSYVEKYLKRHEEYKDLVVEK